MFLLYFTIYSFLGWCIESGYLSLNKKQWINSGFLVGPFIPIYGFGALFSILFLFPYRYYPLFVFIISILATSILEYLTSYILERIFHIRLWDYTDHYFHLHGRICVLNSLLFGILSLFLIYIVHPIFIPLLSYLSPFFLSILTLILIFYFVIDFAYSSFQLFAIQQKQMQFNEDQLFFHHQLSSSKRIKQAFPDSKISELYPPKIS